MKRIRVVHKRLGELLGYEIERSQGQVKIKLDLFERPAIVGARYVSEADELEEEQADGRLAQ